jgi:hypothetical protein
MCSRIALILALALAASATAAQRDTLVSLGKGIIQYNPPPEEWVVSSVSAKGEEALYTLPGKGRMQLSAIAGIAPKTPEAENLMRAALLDEHRVMRNQSIAKDNTIQIVKPLALETDERFFVVLREQFQKSGNTFEQTHYYRNLGPHQFVVSLIALADSEENIRPLREAAEKVMLSAALVPKGQKAPPPPVLGAEVAAAKPTPEKSPSATQPVSASVIAAAQKELDSAVVKCEAELAKNPQYQAAKSKADAAEAKLKKLREQSPPDRNAIAKASEEWLELKRPVETLRQAALAKDPAVVEARKKLAEARAKK